MLERIPGPFAILAIAISGLFGILTAARGLIDADYYWHVTAGEYVAKHGVTHVDPFSYTWGGRPWVMHEWLGELVIWWLTQLVGTGVATFVFGLIGIAGPIIVGWTLHHRGIGLRSVAVALVLVSYLFVSYVTIRPQAISWLLLGILLAGLISLRADRPWQSWLAVPLFLLWANVHGLYVVGLAVLGCYVLFTVLGRTPMAARRWEVVGVLVASFAASAVTPEGPAGLLYPLRYVDGGDWGLEHIAEWQSPDFHDQAQLGLLLFIVALLVNGFRATPGWLAALGIGGLVAALLATRNVPLAALLGLPTLALGMDARWPASRVARERSVQLGRRMIEMTTAVVVLAAAAIILPRLPAVAGSERIGASFPVAAVDRLVGLDADARVFAEYGWGGYLIHRLNDSGGRVFVDGRNDMYSEEILDAFVTIRNAEGAWERTLDRYGADAIVLPPAAPLASGVAQEAGWCEAHRDAVAVLLLRRCP